MVALPSVSPSTSRAQSGQPIDLPQRAPGDRPAISPLAPDTNPSLPTAYPASQSSESQPTTQPESHQPGDDESAAEDAAYSPLLKDHVFALYCAGQRSPAIAAQLGIPERTIRHWIRATLQQLAEDDVTASPELARQQRALAIECQRAAAASAWDTYHRLTAAHNQLLDLALMSTIRQSSQSSTSTDAPQPDAEAATREQRLFTSASRLASAAARYLSLAISANREIAHLQGHAITQDARERQAIAAREAADARQLEADLIRAFTTPVLPPEPAPRHASAYASSWPGGITMPSTQPRPAASIGSATMQAAQPDQLAKTATSLGTAQAVSQSEKAAKTAMPLTALQLALSEKTAIPPTLTTRHLARPTLPSPAHGGGAGEGAYHPQGAEQPQRAAMVHGDGAETLQKTKIAAKTATPTSHAVSKPPQSHRPASAKRKPQLILPSHQHPAAHPAS